MKKLVDQDWREASVALSVLSVLQSEGMEPVVKAIRNKLPAIAESLLMDIEADHAAEMYQYTAYENRLIDEAIEECWKQIDRLKDDQPLLKQRPCDGKHSVTDGDMPEPNTLLIIDCAENADSVGGGAAVLGDDGKWYWSHDWKQTEECKYTVTHWCYL